VLPKPSTKLKVGWKEQVIGRLFEDAGGRVEGRWEKKRDGRSESPEPSQEDAVWGMVRTSPPSAGLREIVNLLMGPPPHSLRKHRNAIWWVAP
jgi:hypothetical protein